MKELVHFTEVHKLDEYDNTPLPDDIFNSEGAIIARKGKTLPKNRLMNTYVYIDPKELDEIKSLEHTDGPEAVNHDRVYVDYEEKREGAQDFYKEFEETSTKLNKSPSQRPTDELLSDSYEEESAEEIEERLEKLEFNPIREIKNELRQNIHQLKDIFRKNIVNGVASLVSKDNENIARQIAMYLDSIIDNSIYASDYMDMITSIRNEDNYLTFAHACSVAFYTVAITRKLMMLKLDMHTEGNMGRWIPLKTGKHPDVKREPVPFSNRLLKYIDHQKISIQMKYKGGVRDILNENLHNLMYEYIKIDPNKKYPSMTIDFEMKNRLNITMAALNHDIGKIMVPNRILNKKEKLNRNEFILMAKHPAYSVAKLKEVGVNNPAMFAYILGHHRISPERGYPPVKNLPPPESKIIAISDIYDAMRSPKHHKDMRSQDEALGHLKQLFDEGCFDLPLYIAAVHTFEEYNHAYVKRRVKSIVDEDKK